MPSSAMLYRIDRPKVRRMSDRGRSWLVGLEGGAKTKAYLDSGGVPTIGVGQTYMLTGGRRRRVAMTDRFVSPLAALSAFYKVLSDFESTVDSCTSDAITQQQFDAFVSLAYNIGQYGFARSSAVRWFNAGEDSERVCRGIRMWNRVEGRISQGLMERRDCECDVYQRGVYRLQGDRPQQRFA